MLVFREAQTLNLNLAPISEFTERKKKKKKTHFRIDLHDQNQFNTSLRASQDQF